MSIPPEAYLHSPRATLAQPKTCKGIIEAASPVGPSPRSQLCPHKTDRVLGLEAIASALG